MAHTINWFEIPVTDMERAKKFYSEILEIEFTEADMMGIKMAFFPMEEGDVSGALCQGEFYTPVSGGVNIYFNCGDDLSVQLARVEKAGGKILVPKTLINEEIGYFAVLSDSEGNTVSFHSKG